jgi:hypothetical protein
MPPLPSGQKPFGANGKGEKAGNSHHLPGSKSIVDWKKDILQQESAV